MVDDAYQPPDSLRSMTHTRHSYYSGGREPLPPPLPFLRHVCTIGITQTPPHRHHPICTGQRPKNAEARGRGVIGWYIDGISVVLLATGDSDVTQIPGKPHHGNGLLMSGSNYQHPEGVEELGQTVADLGAGGQGCSDFGSFLT